MGCAARAPLECVVKCLSLSYMPHVCNVAVYSSSTHTALDDDTKCTYHPLFRSYNVDLEVV